MRVGVVDVDSHNFPNLCLMKLSAFHKQRGDSVEFALPLLPYDRIYMARVFDDTYTHDDITAYQCEDIIKGGTGYDLNNTLPYDIEHIYPDYSLYNITDTAYGFLTRGCPRHCPFCIVGDKEGTVSRKVADLDEFWKGQKNIVLLDPNIVACKEWKPLLQQLIDSKAWVEFNQGIDIRLITEEKAEMISRIKLRKSHMAWDNYPDEFCYSQLKKFARYFPIKKKAAMVYVLTNFNTTHEQDLERVIRIRELGYDPFVMVYNKPAAPVITKRLQAWCNNKWIFKKCENFEDYVPFLKKSKQNAKNSE